MSKITDFYRLKTRTPEGYSLEDIWKFDFLEMEKNHTYIQWMFPSDEPSSCHKNAPVLNNEDIEAFANDKKMRINLLKSFNQFVSFLGINPVFEINELPWSLYFSKANNFVERSSVWLTPKNHNFLRTTRMLKSMTLLGYPGIAKSLLEFLLQLRKEGKIEISDTTIDFWENAVKTNSEKSNLPEIQIHSAKSMILNYKKFANFYIVSIRNSKTDTFLFDQVERLCKDKCKGFLPMVFDDVWLPEHERLGYVLPKKEIIEEALMWAKNKGPFIVHCKAGISRSSAVAYLIACLFAPPEKAIKVLNQFIHSPNELIVKFGAEILENEEIVKELVKFENEGKKMMRMF